MRGRNGGTKRFMIHAHASSLFGRSSLLLTTFAHNRHDRQHDQQEAQLKSFLEYHNDIGEFERVFVVFVVALSFLFMRTNLRIRDKWKNSQNAKLEISKNSHNAKLAFMMNSKVWRGPLLLLGCLVVFSVPRQL